MADIFKQMFQLKYFRSYPWAFQLVLFLLMVFTLMGLTTVLSFVLVPVITGVHLNISTLQDINEQSPLNVIHAAMVFQFITSIGLFALPSLLYAYMATPMPATYLGLRKPGKPIQWMLVLLIILGAMPVLLWIGNLISQINFGADIKAKQDASEKIQNAFLKMTTPGDYIKAVIVMGLAPAFGEELFFRGTLLRFAKKRSNSMIFPILFTAAVFAFVHSNIYGFLSIFLAGVLLAVIYNLTGSLWCSMLGHFFYNSLQITMLYLQGENNAVKHSMDTNGLPWPFVAGGAILFGISFYLLLKNKTPLRQGWENDFSEQELSSNAY